MIKKFLVFGFLFLVAAVAVTLLTLPRDGGERAANGTDRMKAAGGTALIAEAEREGADGRGRVLLPEADAAEEADEEPLTEEERAEAEEEKRIEAFEELTDKWMEPSEKGVTMADGEAFLKQFRAVPKARREEELQRALNLIPDENVMLLAYVLLDKSQDKDLLELAFNDILNRDEDVKTPILRQVLKDRAHPCWEDAAWVLDEPEDGPAK